MDGSPEGESVRRGLLIGLLVAAFAASTAASAQAFSAYTGDAQPGVNTAAVYGYVDTSNINTEWAFEYGLDGRYGHWTSAGTIPAGNGTVMVAALLTGLTPQTGYRYRLVAVPMTSGKPNYAWTTTGDDRGFRTERDGLKLLMASLALSHSAIQIVLGCASTRPCHGSVSVRLRSQPRSTSCAKAGFKIPAGADRVILAKPGARCSRLLSGRRHRLAAVLTARLATGQPKLVAPVTVHTG